MAFRTGPVFKIATTNQPQPLFGSWITAVSPANGFAKPAGAPLTLTLGTAANAGNDATQIFIAGEPAWLVNPDGTNGEVVQIASISGNTVVLGPRPGVTPGGQQNQFTEYSHAVGAIGTGSLLFPKQMVNNFLVDFEDGGTGTFLYLGNQYNMTAVFRRFFKLAKTTSGIQPQYFNAAEYSPGNPIDLSELWVYGTSGDLWNMSIMID